MPSGKPSSPDPSVGAQTRHAGDAAIPGERPGAADTLPADSGPGDGWTVAADPATGASTGRFDRYQLGAELGRGGMGRVVEAIDTRLGRRVAIKEALPRGLDLRRRFEREVRITARLEHPSIVPLYDAGVTPDGNPYYVMRKVSGRPLDRLIADARSVGERLTLVPVLLAAIDAIAHAHRRGVVHRDLKPGNVLVGEHGETVVIDWGLAKAIDEEDDDPIDHRLAPSDAVETQIGAVFGTPGFMAPEQARGEPLDPRSDVYALGATLYQLLSGRPPHTGTSATEVIDRSLGELPPALAEIAPGVPPDLVTITDKAMAFDREQRYADAGALAEDVRRFLAGQLVAAHRYTLGQRLARFVRRHRAAVAIAALAVVAIAVGSAFGIHGIVTERDRAMRAERAAVTGQRAAEEARDREADRADELLVTQARSLVDVNPTAALAALKLVSPRSPRLRSARMVAISAAAQGAAWGYPGHGRVTGTLELAPDGTRLLTAGESGGFRIQDLDHHQEVLAVEFPEPVRAAWIADGEAVLVAPTSGGLYRFDARTGARTALAVPAGGRITNLAVTARGDHVYAVDVAGTIHHVDVATGAVSALALPPPASLDVAVSADGRWLLTAARSELRVVRTADGAVLARTAGQGGGLTFSPDGRRGAAIVDGRVVTVELGGDRPAVQTIDPPITAATRVFPLQVFFRGDDLVINRLAGPVQSVDAGGRIAEIVPRLSEPLMMGAVAIGDLLVFADGAGHLVLSGSTGLRTIRAPAEVQLKRVAARPDSRFVAVAADELVLVWDLDRMLPTRVSVGGSQGVVFRDDNTVLLTPMLGPWQLLDVRSGARTPIELGGDFATAMGVAVGSDGRMIAMTIGDNSVLYIQPGVPRAERLPGGATISSAALLPGGRYALGTTAGEVMIGATAADRQLVHREPSAIDRLLAAGDGIAVRTAADALVRLDAAGREVGRVDVPGLGDGDFAVDDSGRFVFGVGPRVAAWNAARVEDLVTLDSDVVGVFATPVGIVAYTAAGMTYTIGADRQAHRVLARTVGGVAMAPTGSLLLARLADGRLVLVDLLSSERAVLPAGGLVQSLAISSDGRRIAFMSVGGGNELALWNLDAPTDAEPDRWMAWLDDVTNAMPSTQPDVLWPWQVP